MNGSMGSKSLSCRSCIIERVAQSMGAVLSCEVYITMGNLLEVLAELKFVSLDCYIEETLHMRNQ